MEHIEHVMVVDADYVDSVAFNLTVNFERMLERRVPPADMARWVECVALDGGLRAAANQQVQVVLVHDSSRSRLANFMPSDFNTELQGQAFKSNLGEFCFQAVQTEAVVTKERLLLDTVQMVCTQPEVKRLMVVVADELTSSVGRVLRQAPEQMVTTVFTMQPQSGGAFRQQMLGYSLMAALGISSAEIDSKLPDRG